MDILDRHLEHFGKPRWRLIEIAIVLLVAVFCVWAYFAELDRVINAFGEVIPQGDVKKIQHLEGGIIIGLPVSEGSFVKVGDPLVELDLATSGINREELQVQLDSLLLKRARLRAEATGDQPVFPEDIVKSRPGLLDAELQLQRARAREFENQVEAAEQRVVQYERALRQEEVRLISLRESLKLAERQLQIVEKVFANNLGTELDLIKVRREVQDKRGEIASLAQGIERSRAALLEARSDLRKTRLIQRRDAAEELTGIEQTIAQLQERLVRADDQERRAVIRSPIDGIVKRTGYNTIGGVVPPGAAIMEIVPSEERLVIEAKLDPANRGYVRQGQRAVIKISAYDFIRYGSLEGVVDRISADTESEGQDNASMFYKLIISTNKNYLGEKEDQYPITPGMQAEVDVHIGAQTVWEYLIRPVLKLKEEAFREP